jgi:NMD protein affecting ribosome stability and mRNA decay
MIPCVLCGQPAVPFLSMLCKACDREQRVSVYGRSARRDH